MTKAEAFKEITSQHKWFIGHYSQGYASQLVQRFKAGQLKAKTVDKVLKKFGYNKVAEEQWELTKNENNEK